jgi:hypothetical protein
MSLEEKSSIGAGSLLRVELDTKPYFVSGIGGLSIKLNSVQVVDLVPFGQLQASSQFTAFDDGDDEIEEGGDGEETYKDF